MHFHYRLFQTVNRFDIFYSRIHIVWVCCSIYHHSRGLLHLANIWYTNNILMCISFHLHLVASFCFFFIWFTEPHWICLTVWPCRECGSRWDKSLQLPKRKRKTFDTVRGNRENIWCGRLYLKCPIKMWSVWFLEMYVVWYILRTRCEILYIYI